MRTNSVTTISYELGPKLSGNKVYCTCRGHGFKFSCLGTAGKNKLGQYSWVCAMCRKPTKLVYESWKDYCSLCLVVFSTPYETVCKNCHAEEVQDDAMYRSWQWAGRLQAQDWLIKYPLHEDSDWKDFLN